MKTYLFNLLDIREGEGTRVSLMLSMGFFMGLFLATITVASTTLFLTEFEDETKYLPIAFLIAGAVGVLFTSSYNFLQNRIPYSVLAILSLAGITALTAFLEFGDNYFENRQTLYFIGFVLIVPLSFLTYLIFWGSFGRLFNTRQAKRLLGLVDVGAMLASFIAYFSIPLLLQSERLNISDVDLYSLSLVSIIGFLILFLIVSTRYLNKMRTFAQERLYFKKLSFKDFVHNRYIVSLSLFVIIGMLAIIFVDYSFLHATTSYFSGDRSSQLSSFISYFEMTIVIFNFLMQTFATDRIVEQYGMRVAMLINPTLVGLFTLSAALLGKVFETNTVIFFLSVAMGKLFMTSLKDALDNQTFRLYLLPIESHVRIDVQTKIEGMATAFGMFLAGSMILLINNIAIFKDALYITLFTLPIVLGWLLITNRMHKGYEGTLQNTLIKNKNKRSQNDERGYTVDQVLEKGLESNLDEKVISALAMMEKLEPALFENALIRLSNSTSPKIKSFVEDRMKALQIDQDLFQNEIKKLASKAYNQSEDSDILSIDPDKLLKLSKSMRQVDRVLAAKLLRKNLGPNTIFIFLELLRDSNPEVRYEALHTARKVQQRETWPVLIEMLESPNFGHHAAAALKASGEAVLPTLENAFHRSGQSEMVMLRIVQIMGRIGSNYALKLLWRKADYPDKRIVKQIFHTLRYIHYQARGKETREVLRMLDVEIGKGLWNMTALEEIPETETYTHLRNALEEELENNYDQIIMLLSLLYDPQSVHLVYENIRSGDPDSIAFALELLDIFIDPDLKPKLFPLFDDTTVQEKLKHLQLLYPRESYNPIQVINYLLNRDFNHNNRWTKACAMHTAAFMPDFRISRGLIGQVFNQDKLLQETAAWVIYNKDRSVYTEIRERLPEADQKFVDSSIEQNRLLNGLDDGFFLVMEITLALKKVSLFSGISGTYVCDLADKVTPIDLTMGQEHPVSLQENNCLYIIAFGSVEWISKENVRLVNRYEIIGDLIPQDDHPPGGIIKARERSVLFKINLVDFYFVMANHHELVQGLLINSASNKNLFGQKIF